MCEIVTYVMNLHKKRSFKYPKILVINYQKIGKYDNERTIKHPERI